MRIIVPTRRLPAPAGTTPRPAFRPPPAVPLPERRPAPPREILREPLERRGQTQLIEDRRPQVGSDAAYALYAIIDGQRGLMKPAAQRGRLPRCGVLRRRELHLQRRQRLAQAVVNLPGDAGSLVL